jgi:hypothetical protein
VSCKDSQNLIANVQYIQVKEYTILVVLRTVKFMPITVSNSLFQLAPMDEEVTPKFCINKC